MKLLTIEAAASPPSVALSLNGSVYQAACDESRATAEHLLSLTENLLSEQKLALAELDGIAVGRGPGSFTGLRVAAATAQGLAYSSNKNVASVSTLAAMAHEAFHDLEAKSAEVTSGRDCGPLLVCLDARKSQVYCALYDVDELGHPRLVSTERVIDPAEVVAQFTGRSKRGIGNAFSLYGELAELDVPVEVANPSARAVAIRAGSGAVAFEAPYLALPEYVRDNVTHGG